MNEDPKVSNKHKDIALDLLANANNSLSHPISFQIIEDTYDIFTKEKTDSQTFQRNLEKLLSQN